AATDTAGGPATSGAGPHGLAAAPGTQPDPHRGVTTSGRAQLDIDEVDLEELARKLYDRVRSLLRTELLVDRERSGLLSDFR
ncbi:MAG: hypothetical protein M3Q48_15875, partial [Actinomycetota bacterium]|nr:hypothetical protein [Actinomycetota bacterium]